MALGSRQNAASLATKALSNVCTSMCITRTGKDRGRGGFDWMIRSGGLARMRT